MKESLCELSASELVARIAAGALTAEEATEAHIQRISAVNPKINAVCVERFDAARTEARAADERRRRGEALGPLHGLPVTVKECLDLTGTPSTFGLRSRVGVPAEKDDPYVARWRAAGAIVLGKTNVSQLLMFTEADNPVYGRTNNPWDVTRTCGGSSGGQGAIIAASGPPLGLGTDIGGSVRVPATFCGVASMKPTVGRLPDVGRLSAPYGQRAIVSQVGVLGRTVADVALGLVVANGGENPRVHPPLPLPSPSSVDPTKLRIAWYDDDGTFVPSPAYARAVAFALSAVGAKAQPWRPPRAEDAERLYYSLLGADGFAGMSRTLGKNPRDRRIRMLELGVSARPAVNALIRAGLSLSGRRRQARILECYGERDADRYFRLVEQQMDYEELFAGELGENDVILCPAYGIPAGHHGFTEELPLAGTYTLLYNLLGWPAGVVPVTKVRPGEELATRPNGEIAQRTAAKAERGSAGLPIGVQVVARPFREEVALAVMSVIEAAAREAGEHPGLAKLESA